MDMHETTIAPVMVFVFAAAVGLFFLWGGSGDKPGATFLMGIVS